VQRNQILLLKKIHLYILRRIQKLILRIKIFNIQVEYFTINLNPILKDNLFNVKQHLRKTFNIKFLHIKVQLIRELNKCFQWWIPVVPFIRVVENLLWIKNYKVTSLQQCRQPCLNSNFLERLRKVLYRKPLFLISH